MLCEVAQLCECPGDVAVRSPQAAVQTRSNLALGVSLRSIRRICVTATPKPPINAAIATIGTDPAARKCASSKQPRNSERSVLQRCGEVVSKQACARLLNPGWGLSSSEGRLYSRRAVRSVLAEPLPAFLANFEVARAWSCGDPQGGIRCCCAHSLSTAVPGQ